MKTKDVIAIAIRRSERAAQEMYFQDLLKMDDTSYKAHVFEYGMIFLELYFQDDQSVMSIATGKNYWKWWNQQWSLWEMDLVKFIEMHRPVFTLSDWHDEMLHLCGDVKTETSFNLFLKLFHNVRI